jgi:glucose-1-phosphate adenylyltransferase
VGKGAVVRDSVLWSGVVVEDGAVLDKVVCDKRCVIGRKAVVGHGKGSPANDDQPASLTCGATVVGMDVKIPPGARIGRNCIVYPGAEASDLKEVPSGRTVRHAAP